MLYFGEIIGYDSETNYYVVDVSELDSPVQNCYFLPTAVTYTKPKIGDFAWVFTFPDVAMMNYIMGYIDADKIGAFNTINFKEGEVNILGEGCLLRMSKQGEITLSTIIGEFSITKDIVTIKSKKVMFDFVDVLTGIGFEISNAKNSTNPFLTLGADVLSIKAGVKMHTPVELFTETGSINLDQWMNLNVQNLGVNINILNTGEIQFMNKLMSSMITIAIDGSIMFINKATALTITNGLVAVTGATAVTLNGQPLVRMDQLIAVINQIMLAFNTHTHTFVGTGALIPNTAAPSMTVSVTP